MGAWVEEGAQGGAEGGAGLDGVGEALAGGEVGVAVPVVLLGWVGGWGGMGLG